MSTVHPVVEINVRLYGDGYGAAGGRIPGGIKVAGNKDMDMDHIKVTIKQAPYSGLADTGAQTTGAGLGLVGTLGLRREDLVPVTMSLNTAVDAEILIIGAVFIEIVGKAETGEA